MITVSFGFFLLRHLQIPITQTEHEIDKKFYLLFEADEIAFDIKYAVSMEAPQILNYLHSNLIFQRKIAIFWDFDGRIM